MLPLLIRMRCNQESTLIQRTGSQFKQRLNSAMTHSKKGAQEVKKMSIKLEVLLYKMAIKTTLMYGYQTWSLTQRQENKISATKMRMLCHI